MPRDMSTDDVLARLRSACQAAGSQRQWALANDIEPVRVSLILSRREQPSQRVLEALGLQRVTVYREA
jgi:hypothetical protein